jgi:hypothetical protein
MDTPDLQLPMPFLVGDTVHDMLTQSQAKVVGLSYEEGKTPKGTSIGCWAIWLENDYLGGGRHPWEIEKV